MLNNHQVASLSRRSIIANLSVYGVNHWLVDAACVGLVFSLIAGGNYSNSEIFGFAFLYNSLAFGSQALFGLIVDRYQRPRQAALIGNILICLAGLSFLIFPLASIILAGLGNALFHVGGGTISLNLIPRRASAPGIFVAPGALGVLAGTLVGNHGQALILPLVFALIILSVLIFVVEKPSINYEKLKTRNSYIYWELILLLLFLSITIRSFIGLILIFPWKVKISWLVISVFFIFLGKGLGGILGDKFGWLRVGVGSLFLSAILLSLGTSTPVVGILGLFFFNFSMPITLVAISNLLPGRPAFAFGLTCLALVLGALPITWLDKQSYNYTWVILFIVLISAAALYRGLRLYYKNI